MRLLLPAALILLGVAPPRQATADTFTLSVAARNSGGVISAYTPVYYGPVIPGAWVYVSLTDSGGVCLIDGTRYGQGFIAHGEPGRNLSGDTGATGIGPLGAFVQLSGCWSYDGTTATLTLTTGTGCPSGAADINGDGWIGVGDIFDFLSAYFAGSALADCDGDGSVSTQDIYEFLTAYLS